MAFGPTGAWVAGGTAAVLGAVWVRRSRTSTVSEPDESVATSAGGREEGPELAAMLTFHEALLEGTGAAMISTDPGGTVRTFNSAAERLLGYTRAEVIGRVTPAIWHDAAEIAARAAELAAEAGEPVAAGFEVLVRGARGNVAEGREWTFVRRDGVRVPVWLVVSALRDRAGVIVGFSGLATDLTERKAAEAAVRRLTAELEARVAERTAELAARVAEVERLNGELREATRTAQASQASADRAAGRYQETNANLIAVNQELESFSYSISHDLRAPLRNTTGFLELLRRRPALGADPEAARFAELALREAQRMELLIDDLLTFSRLGRTELRLEPVALGDIVDSVRRELATETAGRRVEWKVEPLPMVRGDAAMLHQVFAHLLSNAVKFTRGREVATIEIGAAGGGGEHAVCRVRDNGAGFNPRYLDKLFGVFQRLHTTRQFEGTGIGLANVKRIITRHGGRVWAEGAVDRGATFYFSVPRADGP
jgi:PAS domain S-box-containing protein